MRFKKVKLPDGNVIIDTGLPQRGLKPAGLDLHTHMLKQLFDVATHDENMENGTVKRLSKFLINTILDMSKRDEALENIDRYLAKEIDDAEHPLSFSERQKAESEIWLDLAVKEFVEGLDAYFGVSHRLAIGTFGTAAPPSEYMEEPQPDFEANLEEEWKEPPGD